MQTLAPLADLTKATPPQIDERLAEIYGRGFAANGKVRRLAKWIKEYRDGLEKKAAAGGGGPYSGWTEEHLAKQVAEHAAAIAEANAIWAETEPYDEEFDRRGGWTRFYRAMSSNGHIHSSQRCKTCNRRGIATEFGWHPEMSGKTEEQALEELRKAAHTMCTICFPNAPLGWDKPPADENECPGSRTSNYDRSKSRTGYCAGNYGHCNECGQNVTIPGRSYNMKKHPKAPAAA